MSNVIQLLKEIYSNVSDYLFEKSQVTSNPSTKKLKQAQKKAIKALLLLESSKCPDCGNWMDAHICPESPEGEQFNQEIWCDFPTEGE